VTGFRSFDNVTCMRVLDLLEVGYSRFWEVIVKEVAVVKF